MFFHLIYLSFNQSTCFNTEDGRGRAAMSFYELFDRHILSFNTEDGRGRAAILE